MLPQCKYDMTYTTKYFSMWGRLYVLWNEIINLWVCFEFLSLNIGTSLWITKYWTQTFTLCSDHDSQNCSKRKVKETGLKFISSWILLRKTRSHSYSILRQLNLLLPSLPTIASSQLGSQTPLLLPHPVFFPFITMLRNPMRVP